MTSSRMILKNLLAVEELAEMTGQSEDQLGKACQAAAKMTCVSDAELRRSLIEEPVLRVICLRHTVARKIRLVAGVV